MERELKTLDDRLAVLEPDDDVADDGLSEHVLAEIRQRLTGDLSDSERREIVQLLVRRITVHTTLPGRGRKQVRVVIDYRFPPGGWSFARGRRTGNNCRTSSHRDREGAMARPNILFITTDQQRGDALGVAGQDWLQTPALDALARDGYHFTRAYSEAPVCVAARTTWMTGTHPWEHRVRGNTRQAMDPAKTLPGVLTAHGYRTHAAGKMHFSPDQRNLNGFESMVLCEEGRMRDGDDYHHWLQATPWAGLERAHGVGNNDIFAAPSPLPESHYVSTWIANQSIRFLHEHTASADERPFFLWCSFTKPHSAYDPPRPYDQLYDPGQVPAPARNGSDMSESPPQLREANRVYTWDALGPEQIALARAFYFGNVTHLDHCIGRLLGTLDSLGIRDDTFIVFQFGPRRSAGRSQFVLQVQLLRGIHARPADRVGARCGARRTRSGTAWPNRRAGGAAPGYARDAAGGRRGSAADVEGPWLTDVMGRRASGEPVHGVFGDRDNLQLALIEERFKYIWWANGRFEQLFDRQSDPGELTNRADDPSLTAVKERMRGWLAEYLGERGYVDGLDGDDLVGRDYDPATMRWGRPNPRPWGRRPY